MNDITPRAGMLPNRAITDPMEITEPGERGALVPKTAAEAMEFAKIMATSDIGVPAHLRDKPGVCLRIISDAMNFGMSPFHLADDSYAISGRLAYGAKAIYAMTLASGFLRGRLDLEFAGDGAALVCTVTGRTSSDDRPKSRTYRLADIKVKNSPLWHSDTRQQLGYYAQRAWCRLYAPDAIMGLVAREDPPIDITPAEQPASALERVTAHLDGPTIEALTQHMDEIAAEAAPAVDPNTGEILVDPATGFKPPPAEATGGRGAGEVGPAGNTGQDASTPVDASASPASPSEQFVAQALEFYAAAKMGMGISDYKTANSDHYKALSSEQIAVLRAAEDKRRQELRGAK